MNLGLQFDYTAVGHVTIDVMPDGSRRPGGAAFYSALQAARLGRRALILTQGVVAEIEALIEPYRGELELQVHPAERTTTLYTWSSSGIRRQRVLAWAGRMLGEPRIDTSILHLAPVARECPTRWQGASRFIGLTPQGLVREWFGEDGEIALVSAAPEAQQLADSCDAVVLSELERASCAELISRAGQAGAVVAITAGSSPTTILVPGGGALELEVAAIERPGDDLGAGDVFAAAFFLGLSEEQTARDAAAFANAAAAVRMRGSGAGAIGDHATIASQMQAAAAGAA